MPTFNATECVKAPVTAILTAWRRPNDLLHSLTIIYQTQPPPAEVLVHLDAGSSFDPSLIIEAFPGVRVLTSDVPVGPGGGRNKLIQAASNELVASFDDDSFPDHSSFFAEISRASTMHPNVAMFAAVILENDFQFSGDVNSEQLTFDFVGCGCVYRRSVFLKTSGYVPVPMAYGMEEVDLALRLHAAGEQILQLKRLRVRHLVNYQRYENAALTAASIANIALLAFLRYPCLLWPLGVAQCIRRALWLAFRRRSHGIRKGFTMIPSFIRAHTTLRSPLSTAQVLSFFVLRRFPKLLCSMLNRRAGQMP